MCATRHTAVPSICLKLTAVCLHFIQELTSVCLHYLKNWQLFFTFWKKVQVFTFFKENWQLFLTFLENVNNYGNFKFQFKIEEYRGFGITVVLRAVRVVL